MATKIPRVSAAEVHEWMERGEPITFVDARNPTDWGQATTVIPGAIRIPADRVQESLPAERLREPVVVYCT